MCKLFVLRIVTWSSNCLLRIIIIIIIISYLKPFNCVQIICIKNCLLRIIIISYLKPYNCVQIICIKNCYLKLEFFTKDYCC